jgi:hypothetical protein|tara:strand:+ start:321 stop:668 length:348 start_codon:yes stop_codon:yes gene_type:complete
MAEALIKLQDSVNPSKTAEEAEIQLYKRGDVIVIRDDGWAWGAKETFPAFEVVSIPGLAADYKYVELPKLSEIITPKSANKIPKLRKSIQMAGIRDALARRKWRWNFTTEQLEAK